MNNKEFKKLLTEWNQNIHVEKKAFLNEVTVKDALIFGLISVAGFTGILQVNKALSSKGEKPAVTSNELKGAEGKLASIKKGNNKGIDEFTRNIIVSARKNPEGVALFLSKHGGENITDVEKVEEEIESYDSDGNPIIKLLARTFEKSQGAENDKISVDGVGEINLDSVNDLEVSGIPASKEQYIGWQQDLINGDKDKQNNLADYFLDGKILGDESIDSLNQLDSVFDNLGKAAESGKGTADLMKIVNNMDVNPDEYDNKDDYDVDKANLNSTKEVMNALSSMKANGAFLSQERIDNLSYEDFSELIDTSDDVTVSLFKSMLDIIRSRSNN